MNSVDGENRRPLGLYCHVPFCADACDFCTFYQEKPRRDDVTRFLEGIERELVLFPPERPADTFFWGGGTPGLLAPAALERLGQAFLAANGQHPPDEWTVEMAPATATRDRLAALRELGVTRISMGVQSFDKETLAVLGRRHLPEQIYRAWAHTVEAAFRDASLDLIFAIPGQDEARWQADLAEAVRLAPQHISTYCLTVEEDTSLYARLARGRIAPNPEHEAALYRATWDFLCAHGYAQYEISNFAREGHACRHNINTWRMEEWQGYGPSAASQCGGQRFQNPANLGLWLDGLCTGKPVREQCVTLTPALLFSDSLIFGLRMNEGVELGQLGVRHGMAPPQALQMLADQLQQEGFLKVNGPHWRLTLEGRLRADAIAVSILDAFG
ncbi:MAG: radical SAM family heme chaperone HemW [Puniceicoccales bacterium]|nr:radical SAM family heme chaperone HemW [Puniceicoccales bacterium]